MTIIKTGSKPVVTVVTNDSPGPAANHGSRKILEALQAKDIVTERTNSLEAARGDIMIITCLADGSGAAGKLLREQNISIPVDPESLVIHRTRWNDKPALLLVGADDRGLIYAELEVADRIGWAEEGETYDLLKPEYQYYDWE